MQANSFLTLFDKADGECIVKGKEKWIEIEKWGWAVEAESSWTKGGGASVGKPNPGKIYFLQHFDTASPTLLGYICTGKAFPKAQLDMVKTTGKATPETFLAVTMEGCFITKIEHESTQEGRLLQRIEMVFKKVKMEYKAQSSKDGTLGPTKTFNWDIPAGTASPSA